MTYVDRSCGHSEKVEIFDRAGANKSERKAHRERRIATEERRLCRDCWLEQRAEAIATTAEAWPVLEGSEKQVKWAGEVRFRMVLKYRAGTGRENGPAREAIAVSTDVDTVATPAADALRAWHAAHGEQAFVREIDAAAWIAGRVLAWPVWLKTQLDPDETHDLATLTEAVNAEKHARRSADEEKRAAREKVSASW